jgi:hypothetical protein
MRKPTVVIDLDVTQPLTCVTGLDISADAAVLCRLRDRPLGFVRATVERGDLLLEDAVRELLDTLAGACGVALAERAIASGLPPRWPDAGTLVDSWPLPLDSGPLVTVAVCTTGREANLRPCLDALRTLDYAPVDILIVDGGSTTGETQRLLAAEYPGVRYVRESRAGLESARRRAFSECKGDILAFTDGDAMVDRYWVSSLVRAFLLDPEVMAVVGPVVPRDPRADAQRLLDQVPASAGGFRRRWYRTPIDGHVVAETANVAFWRGAFGDDGSLGRHGRGHVTVVFEPSAIVRGSRGPCRDTPQRVAPVQRSSPATRRIDLADPIRPIADAAGSDQLQIEVSWNRARLGDVTIDHYGAVVRAAWLTDAIAQELTVPVLDAHTHLGEHVLWSTITSTLARALLPAIERSRRDRRRRLPEAA